MLAQLTSTALALREDALDPFDADQRARIPAAVGLAAVTPAELGNPTVANLRDSELVSDYRADRPQLTPRAVAVLVEIVEMREENQDPNYDKFLGYLANLIWEAGDSKRILADVAELISGVRAEATR